LNSVQFAVYKGTTMPLSRDEVLQGALRQLDDDGFDALTMRHLADALGVQAGAIYWHFANKQELIDAMVEALMSPILAAPLAGRWDQQLAEISRRIAVALSQYHDGAVLVTKALQPGQNALAVSEKMLEVARGAGFSKDEALSATAVLGYYVLGYVTDMQATEAAKARGLRAVLRSFVDTIDKQRFPRLSELGGTAALEKMTTEKQFQQRFEYGLQVILDGLRSTLRGQRKAKPPTARTPTKPTKPTPPRPRRRR
jgi:AcrR family transcriptional regulator